MERLTKTEYRMFINDAISETTSDYNRLSDRWSKAAEIAESRGGINGKLERRYLYDKKPSMPIEGLDLGYMFIGQWIVIAELKNY